MNYFNEFKFSAEEDEKSCFAWNSKVKTANGVRLIQELKVGDEAQCFNSDGYVVFSPLIMMGHVDKNCSAEFIEIKAQVDGIVRNFSALKVTLNFLGIHFKSLLITPRHFVVKIYQGKVTYTFAENITANDTVLVEFNGILKPAKVIGCEVMYGIIRNQSILLFIFSRESRNKVWWLQLLKLVQ